ncbi:PREDICTED: exosome complex component RRP41 [Ceratosolen solmsi marchali]|uniref:Putative exosome complex component RRP41 n=1 Tax=Ceratosolen solmsi marchali TaxID=326594 RepID=A0AAJ6YKP7_9HYME|nr:PREDICTED: exosome complex component RRP41 [Ceratosolen solmsi marchali]
MESEFDINQGGLRADGRRPLELRRIRMRLGVFTQADGSAYVEQGKTKILATVYGPHQPRGKAISSSTKDVKGIVNCQYSSAVFSFGAAERKKKPRGDRKSQEASQQLRHAMEAIINLELFARSQIDIFVEILQMDGSEFCVAVNAATLALIDAGISIKDYAIGCSITVSDSLLGEDDDGQCTEILDANWVEECCPSVTLSIVALPKVVDETETKSSVILTHGSGQRLHLSKLEPLRIKALQGCKDIRTIIDEAVKNHLEIFSIATALDK